MVSSSVNATNTRSSIIKIYGSGHAQQPKSIKVWVYCRRTGPTVDVCYSKHDYPLRHPQYLTHLRFHNPNNGFSFGFSSVNHTVTNDDQISLHKILDYNNMDQL
ncbi:hypothetical protein LR48_Vigan03g227400 [Vigna angularis]|uniref:Uncharacterized protein n=1 Tax=Phaseolus angularis TaxID=3914 RepID=A0A0L9U886_PHAAN|nr:hypothetical protein LR48_Vigan03g227400 [Vigna angularis]